MSALSVVLSTRVGRRKKIGEVSCTECTLYRPGNYFELIRTVIMETQKAAKGYFGSEFPVICNHCGVMAALSRKTLKILINSCVFLEKRPLTVKFSKFCSEIFHRDTNWRVVFKFRAIWPTENRRNGLITILMRYGIFSIAKPLRHAICQRKRRLFVTC